MMSTGFADKTDILEKIKEECKEARSRLGLSNRDIADKITVMFNCGDFSVNTVNNFFSDRSKATTIYTAGYICAALGVSIDRFFEIEPQFSAQEKEDMSRRLSELEQQLALDREIIENQNKITEEKDNQLAKADKAIQHYRSESTANRKTNRSFVIILIILLVLMVANIIYLLHFDFPNPDFGLFKAEISLKNIGITPLS